MRNRKTLFASLFIAMFLCTMPHAFAKVWYVKTTGNNANSGATETLAKASIQAMLNSTSVVSGDTILVWGGTYQEQVVTGNLNVTIIGSQGTGRTIIQAPAWASMVSYTFVDAMNWNGADKLSSNKLKPIVFANASSSSIITNIRGIDIDGSTANMPEGATEVFAGLAYRQSQGLIGGYGDSTYNEVRNITPTANTNALNNTVGVLFIERAKPTMIGTRVKNYRNIGVGSIGMNTSALQTVQDHQPSPIIINCIVQGVDGGTSSSDENAIQAGLVVVNGARVNISKSHIYGNRSGNATGNRIAYGIYTWNARNSTIGDGSVKANGNVISDNEIGLYVRVTVSSFSPTLYTIRNNNIVYNGGTAANLGTPAGKVANYASATASFVTYGAVRFSHSSNFAQPLNVSNNAWGNSEAQSVFNQSNAGYTVANYVSNPVAFWRETSNDNIIYSLPLSPATSVQLNVSPTYAGSNTTGAPSVDVNYGYTKFDQLNRAVYAADVSTSASNDPTINLLGHVVENGSVIITKPVKIIGSGATCDVYPSVKLRDDLNEPTVWVYGMRASNGDYTDRTPVRDELNKIQILANNTQTAGGPTDGPAVLITGGTDGAQSPVQPVFSYMSISEQFDGSTGPQAYSTSQSGTSKLSKRYAVAAAGPYYALYTRRPENCNNIVGDPHVIDQTDNSTLPKFQYDNIVEVTTCTELNNAIAAATGPDFTTMLIVADIGTLQSPCEVFVNSVQPIVVDIKSSKVAYIHYLLNPGTGPGYGGASNAICNFLRTPNVDQNVVRVTAYPPTCLQTAVNLISSGSDNLLVAADGAPFTDAGSVTISKAFDFMGATNATAHNASPNEGHATYTGVFELESGADINHVGSAGSSLTSTRGNAFGDADNQVDLNFTNTGLANFGGDAIEMALQLINSTSGSRRMELTTNSHLSETPTISKRVYLNGLANRGTTVGAITLNGSGNCTDPSVLRNLSAATITVNSNSDCIQTALGIANCTTYTQNIEGVGTNATNGSGGTVNLNNVAYTQNVDISKSVTFTNSNTTTGTVTLRRGANLLGGLSNFAPTVNLEQCVAFANATKPDPQQAITIVNNSGSGIVNIAGYGEADSDDGTTPAQNGLWSFSNIDVTKDIEIRGNFHSTSATDLTCAIIAGSTLPALNSSRIIANETTIGAYLTDDLSIGAPIFKINSNGVSIKGFRLKNVGSSSSDNAFVRIFGTSSNIEVANNIVSGSVSADRVIGLVRDNNAGNKSNIDVSNNYYSTNSSSYSVVSLSGLRDGAAASSAMNNVINGTFGSDLVFEYRDIVNTVNDGLIVRNNWVNASSSAHGIHFWPNGANTLSGILVEQNHFRGCFVGLSFRAEGQTGSNLFRVRENYFNANATGIRIDNDLSTMTTNEVFINNNNLEGNTTAGISIEATTSNAVNKNNMLDLRFNWWGNGLGPVKAGNVQSTPDFLATVDSTIMRGHIPFTHAFGSKLSDNNTHGRWQVYPAAVSATDGTAGTCGWQYSEMMQGVLLVSSTNPNDLKGNFTTIENGRAGAPISGKTRESSDQLYILGPSTYGAGSFGYPTSAGHETYPVIFNNVAANEPSSIRGLTYPTINAGTSTGTIQVGSNFPGGFTVRDFIKFISAATDHTVLSFANTKGNRVQNTYMTSDLATPTSYTGISMAGGSTGEIHTIQDNRINMTDGAVGNAWPGSSTEIAKSSTPATFKGIVLNGSAGASAINVICNHVVAQSTSGSTGITFTSAVTNSGDVNIETNNVRGNGVGVNYTFSNGYGFDGNITTRENFIVNGIEGIRFEGTFAPMITNKIFANNNNLEDNSIGVRVHATTKSDVATTNMLDLRFNWWGNALGPVKDATVSATPAFEGTDSLNIKGHVPFTHTTGSSIVDDNLSTGRWMIYPSATVATDANGVGCGWQYTHMMPAVLRVNAAGNSLLGAYATITEGRDGATSGFGITNGTRDITDQLYILGPSSYDGATFGYPSTTGHESYPISFTASPQPSTIKGLTYPTINAGTSTGTISVGSAFPAGFSVLDYIKYISAATHHVVLNFENTSGNTVKNNYMTSNISTSGTYTGINIKAGAVGQTHTIQDNKINLTDGNTGEAWPGSSLVTTNTSVPSSFRGISLTLTSTAANVNIICNDIIAQSTSGAKGIDFISTVSNSGLINIEKNNIRKMGIGIHYNLNAPFGFTNNLTTKENFIVDGTVGIQFNGTFVPMTMNKIFVNNNNLSNNTGAGVNIQSTTANNIATTNMLDLRFNWWGSEMGPKRGSGVASIPSLALSDSLVLKGYVPFNHNSGSSIVDVNTDQGRWVIYPSAVTSTDATLTNCGWQYKDMMGAVLRVNSDGDDILGMYPTITAARDAGTSSTEQIFVIANSSYGLDNFGYDGTTSNEPSYPVVFSASTHPSTIRGINRPRILSDGTGSISVTTTGTGFNIRDYIEHVGTTTTYTALNFANAGSNVAENNFITSTVASPTSFTGISLSNATASLTQRLDSNRIKLATNPRWPNGPAVAASAPVSFKGIDITGHGADGTLNIGNNDISVASASGTKSTGIFVNATTSSTKSNIYNNTIHGMAAAETDADRSSEWGTAVYVRHGSVHAIGFNDIQGGNSVGTKGHDGITLDRTGINTIMNNTISTVSSKNLSGINMTGDRQRGYGIKLFSSTGTDNIGASTIINNTIGSSSATAPGVASIYIGGTSGTISPINIVSNTIINAVESKNAAVQIATSQYAGTATSADVTIQFNTIGSTTSGQSNAMFLAIGTDGNGSSRNSQADNYIVNVYDNDIRTSAQTIGGSSTEVADGRPNAGMNIRNIFGYETGSQLNGDPNPGKGTSGNNTFTHAAILTSEPNHANYNYYTSALSRTAKAVAFDNPTTTPVTIERLIATPLNVAGWADTANTVELRENAGFNINTEGLYYNESLTFPDRRILVSGPRTGARAELLPSGGGTGTMFTSNGRENKDIRGAIRMNAIGAGMFGQVSAGAENKGDVYLQLDNVGADNAPVSFRYHGSTLGSQVDVTQLNNGLDKTLDIKAGMDDADDDGFAANGSTTRRTGVFRSGTATSQFLKETPEAITGANVLNVYPNPASGDVTVAFHIPVEGAVRVALYNALGEKVTDLREEYLSVDNYTTSFSGANLPSGTYHVRLVHDLFTRTVPVTIIK